MDDVRTVQQAALCLLLVRKQRCLAALGCRRVWERSWIGRREGRGVYSTLLRELDAEDPEMFRRSICRIGKGIAPIPPQVCPQILFHKQTR